MEEQVIENNNGIIIVNIVFGGKVVNNKLRNKEKELPTVFAVDLPKKIKELEDKSIDLFNDVVETFAYDFLTKTFGVEVTHCQVYLPLK